MQLENWGAFWELAFWELAFFGSWELGFWKLNLAWHDPGSQN